MISVSKVLWQALICHIVWDIGDNDKISPDNCRSRGSVRFVRCFWWGPRPIRDSPSAMPLESSALATGRLWLGKSELASTWNAPLSPVITSMHCLSEPQSLERSSRSGKSILSAAAAPSCDLWPWGVGRTIMWLTTLKRAAALFFYY